MRGPIYEFNKFFLKFMKANQNFTTEFLLSNVFLTIGKFLTTNIIQKFSSNFLK